MSNDTQSHYEKFQYNDNLSTSFTTALPDNLDWCCVIKFYAALHLVQGYLVTKNLTEELDTHGARANEIRKYPELQRGNFPRAYRELKDVSEQVRYDPGFQFTASHDTTAERNFRKVVSVVEPLVKKFL